MLPGCCPRWIKGLLALVHSLLSNTVYTFTAAGRAGIVASDFRFISYWLRASTGCGFAIQYFGKSASAAGADTPDAVAITIRRQIIQRAKLFFAAVERDSVQLRLSSAGNVDQPAQRHAAQIAKAPLLNQGSARPSASRVPEQRFELIGAKTPAVRRYRSYAAASD